MIVVQMRHFHCWCCSSWVCFG